MDDPNRSSGLPRLSRLPLARPSSSAASGIPKPASTIPRPASLRPAPSREALRGRASAAGGEIHNPKLRSSTSQSQLRSSVNNTSDGRNSRLRTSASREQLQGSTPRAPAVRTRGQPPVAMAKHSRVPSTPQRRTSSMRTVVGDIEPVEETSAVVGEQADSQDTQTDQVLFKRRLTLTRRPSETFAAPPFPEAAFIGHDDASHGSPAHAAEEAPAVDMTPARSLRPRPSLSERTMETLARVPPSPALRKKSSAFFEPSRPKSRVESDSRPGSSYNSDGSTRPASRPGSSTGPTDSGLSSFRASTSSFKTSLDPIGGTPRRISGIQGVKTPKARQTPGRNSLAGSAKASSVASFLPDRSPSPDKRSFGMPPPASASKTVGARPLRPRASVNGLFKKPSLPAVRTAARESAGSRQASVDSNETSTNSWDGTITSLASTNTSLNESPEPLPSSARKSSAALRDQIAKARAAKRAAVKQEAAAIPAAVSHEASIIPSDDGFDFGVVHEDPFNARKGEDPKKRVLNQRVSAARSSGKLNIAALGLKEIPMEVMKMYDLESVGGGNWAESVDLTRLVAADNEFETLDDFIFPDSAPGGFDEDEDSPGHIFAGLETLDMHGNLLMNVPMGFRRLANLTSMNLSSNRLTNNSLDTISQMASLRDLKLANNLLYGPLNSVLTSLDSLEILDLHGNNISALPSNIGSMTRLRILNLNENSFETLDFDGLSKLPLTELSLKKNKLSGTLIEEPLDSLPHLQTLDVSMNQLTRLVPLGSSINLPVLHALSLSMNRLQGLPDMTSWTSLLTLTVDENSISGIPNSFTSLEKLRHADFSSNDIRVVPPEIARMDNLSMIRLSGNPLRDKKFVSITTEDLKEILASRLEPPPPYQEPGSAATITELMGDAKTAEESALANADRDDDSRSDFDDDFATPPTSAPHSPSRSRSHTVSSMRSRSRTLSNQTWPVKPGGILDRSRTESSSLHPVVCSKVAEHQVRQVYLQHNLFNSLPNSLSFFAATLSSLSLANNQLVGESYLQEELELPSLRELNLASNRITSLDPLIRFLHAPELEKIDASMNRISVLPLDLKAAFPKLNVLLVSTNQLMELDPDAIKGLRIVEAANNDITHLNPKIGLLGGQGGLQRLEVMGNRFRVPRWNVLERGTDATLRWLRGRVPVAEMAAWRKENDEGSADDLD